MKKYFTIGLTISLIAVSLLFYFQSLRSVSLQVEVNQIAESLSECQYVKSRINERYSQCILSEDVALPNIHLQDSEFHLIRLSSIMDAEKLVYRFYESTCSECVDEDLKIVKQLSDSIGDKNIVIISDFKQIRNLRATLSRHNIRAQYFISENRFDRIPFENDANNIPTFFITGSSLRTKFVHKGGNDQQISDAYFKRVINYFKTSK